MRFVSIACLLATMSGVASAAEHIGSDGNWVFERTAGVRTAAHISTNAELRVTCPDPGAAGAYSVYAHSQSVAIEGLTEFAFDTGDILALPLDGGRFEVMSAGSGAVFEQFIMLLKQASVVAILKEGRSVTSFSLNGAAEMIGACPVQGL
ncbi:MAG: hypothetical protein AAGB10_16405 [Pseudomonadota bacterium]